MVNHPNRQLSSTMRAVLEVARARGCLERWPGGFWTYPGCSYQLRQGGLGVPVKVPEWWAGAQTVHALLARGLLEVTERRDIGPDREGFATKVSAR